MLTQTYYRFKQITNKLRGTVIFVRNQVSRLVTNFLTFYGNRVYIIVFTWARYMSLSWANTIQSTLPNYFLKTYFNIIPAYMPKLLFLSFPYPTLHAPLFAPIRATVTAHLIIPTPTVAVTLSVFGPNTLRSILFSNTLSLCSPPTPLPQCEWPNFTPKQDNRQN